MIGDFGSKLPPSPHANGLLLTPPFGIWHSQARPERVAVLTALACSTNQRIVSLPLIQPPAHMIHHHTKLQAAGDSFVANGMNSTLRGVPSLIAVISMCVITVPLIPQQKTAITKQFSVQIPLLNHQCPSKSLNPSSHDYKSQTPFVKDMTYAGTFMT